GQLTELRAFKVGPRKKTVTELYTANRLEEMARRALEVEADGASGVYFVPNAIKPETKKSAGDGDIKFRRWLLVDLDPVRFGPDAKPLPDQKVSSTEEEREAAWEVLCLCRAELELAGLGGEVVGDSGNGWHLCYPVKLANDDAAKELHKALLHGLNERCGTDR